MAEIIEIIRPIVRRAYGSSEMTQRLIVALAKKIEEYEPGGEHDTREHMIQMACWMVFSGGMAAENTARRIEAALQEAGK